jgi:hypothetical protein
MRATALAKGALMLIGALLILLWFILLLRYPLRALPISLGAAAAFALVVGWAILQDRQQARLLERLKVTISYEPRQCPAARPLLARLTNHSDRRVSQLSWRIAAYVPNSRLNVAQGSFEKPDYSLPADLQAGASWQSCLPLPTLRSGYRASTLSFGATDLEGEFTD